MLKRDEGTTDFRRCEFGVVEGNDHGERADTETGSEPTTKNVGVGTTVSACLDDDTDAEYTHGYHIISDVKTVEFTDN